MPESGPFWGANVLVQVKSYEQVLSAKSYQEEEDTKLSTKAIQRSKSCAAPFQHAAKPFQLTWEWQFHAISKVYKRLPTFRFPVAFQFDLFGTQRS